MSMDEQIARAEEEAASRKPIMEKVEKWILACDEERWLEEYSRVSCFLVEIKIWFALPIYVPQFSKMNISRMRIGIQSAEVLTGI